MTKKRLLSMGMTFLIPMAALVVLSGVLGRTGTGIEAALALPPDALFARESGSPIVSSAGIPFDLHGFDAAFNGDWGYWCETVDTGSNAACADYGLLSSSLVTTMTHSGESGVSLKLSYTVTQTNTLASYYEHLYQGGTYTDPLVACDLSHLNEYRFWVKGEGNTIDENTRFWIRFADIGEGIDWNMVYTEVTGVSDQWQEKTLNLKSLRSQNPDINWRRMREITIIFENNRGGSGRVANPPTGTLYFDLIGLTSPDSDPTFPDPLNNFIAGWGYWCETDDTHSDAACADYGLLSSNVVTTPRHGDSGASLKLSYAVTQTNTLASHYERLYSGDTFYDLSSFDAFRFWVRGEGDTIGDDTRFYIRFADVGDESGWRMVYTDVVGVSNQWQEKTIDLKLLRNQNPNVDWEHMREVTIIFENNGSGSGRVAHPLAGTLYFDDLAFVDLSTSAGTDDQFLELLERRAFQYFWEYADPTTGLVRDAGTEPNMSSIAAVGFGLTSICAANERGWISHEAAYTRALTTLNSFYDDPSDPNDLVVSGTHGLFYHFVDIHDGTPMLANVDGVSTIDTALLMAGVLSVRQCFTETEIITRATAIYEAAEWDWFFDPISGTLTMCWTPQDEYPSQCWTEEGQRNLSRVWHWAGYNEAMILYLLAIGSPTHPISATSWISWTSTYQWGAYYGYPVLVHGPSPLFGHQYSHAWIDFRDQRDDYANYFRNSRYATLAHRAYSLDVWYPDRDLWGTTSSHGPIAGTCSGRTYRASIGYPPDPGNNDGTIAPTAAGGSIAFTPQESISTLRHMYDHYHQRLWGLYGLKDSMNARCEPDWFDNDYIGINVGAMLLMIENHRSGLVWSTFMKNQEIVEAMEAVGFIWDQTREPSWFYYREAEQHDVISGTGIQEEGHSEAWNGKTLQIDPGHEPNPGNQATYTFTVHHELGSSVLFEIRYSEGVSVPTDTISVYLDGVEKGDFTTDHTADDWNSFCWDEEVISLGTVSPGPHTITLRLTESAAGSHGVNLDVFRLYTTLDITKQADPDPVDPGALLSYTLSITNTSGLTLTATITDVLPSHVTPGNVRTWTPITVEPGGVWTQPLSVATEVGYLGSLTNVVQVTTVEGPAGIYTETSKCGHHVHLPLMLKGYSSAETMTLRTRRSR
jgi:uncharacterized repeat protein (TIGR01451 family)